MNQIDGIYIIRSCTHIIDSFFFRFVQRDRRSPVTAVALVLAGWLMLPLGVPGRTTHVAWRWRNKIINSYVSQWQYDGGMGEGAAMGGWGGWGERREGQTREMGSVGLGHGPLE